MSHLSLSSPPRYSTVICIEVFTQNFLDLFLDNWLLPYMSQFQIFPLLSICGRCKEMQLIFLIFFCRWLFLSFLPFLCVWLCWVFPAVSGLAEAVASGAALHAAHGPSLRGLRLRQRLAPLRLRSPAGPGIQLMCPAGGFCSTVPREVLQVTFKEWSTLLLKCFYFHDFFLSSEFST